MAGSALVLIFALLLLSLAIGPTNAYTSARVQVIDVGAVQQWMAREGGYAMIQATKPQTLAYGLSDSPVGLAGWIVEKFRSLSDCGGQVERRFSKDELLTTIMIYWVSETINSSIRTYYENLHLPPGAR